MSDELAGRILGAMDKYASIAEDKARADVAGKPFNLMAPDDVARVMDAKGEALTQSVTDAVTVAAGAGVEVQNLLSDALSTINSTLKDAEGVDTQSIVNELGRVSQATQLAGDKSRNGQEVVATAIRELISMLAKSQAEAKANADGIVSATEKNTKALEKVAKLLGADKAVDYDENGRPAKIRVSK